MSKSLKDFWLYRYQEKHIAELLRYLDDKRENSALVFRLVHDAPQHTFQVDTHAGTYSNVLFPEIERFSEGWTKYNVSMWKLAPPPEGCEWTRLRTAPEWRNSRPQGVSPSMYVRVDIELIKPTEEEETKDANSS